MTFYEFIKVRISYLFGISIFGFRISPNHGFRGSVVCLRAFHQRWTVQRKAKRPPAAADCCELKHAGRTPIRKQPTRADHRAAGLLPFQQAGRRPPDAPRGSVAWSPGGRALLLTLRPPCGSCSRRSRCSSTWIRRRTPSRLPAGGSLPASASITSCGREPICFRPPSPATAISLIASRSAQLSAQTSG